MTGPDGSGHIRVTRLASAPGYVAAKHHGVSTVRLQGLEAGPTEAFWAGLSWYLPGGGADESPTAAETVYVVLEGELVLTAGGQEHVLGPQDSVHLAKGTVRRVDNRSPRPAGLLVIIAQDRPPGAAPPPAASDVSAGAPGTAHREGA